MGGSASLFLYRKDRKRPIGVLADGGSLCYNEADVVGTKRQTVEGNIEKELSFAGLLKVWAGHPIKKPDDRSQPGSARLQGKYRL